MDEVDEARLQWLVPGLFLPKVEALLKGLPKPLRRQLVPVPDAARAIVEELAFAEGDIYAALQQVLKRRGVVVTAADWSLDSLDHHYRFNIRIVGEGRGKEALPVLAEGREWLALKQQARAQKTGALVSNPLVQTVEQHNLADFPTQDIPEFVALSSKGGQSRAYPALVWVESPTPVGVDLRLFASRQEAETAHYRGLNRLFQIVCADACRQIRKRVTDHKSLILQYAPYGNRAAIEEGFVFAVVNHVFMTGRSLVYTRAAFEQRLQEGRPKLLTEAECLIQALVQTFAGLADVQARLEGFQSAVFTRAVADVKNQIQALKPAEFLQDIPYLRWQHYPRYFKALAARLEKLANNVTKDEAATVEINARWQAYQQRAEALKARDIFSEALEEYRWLLEEYRISLFAQTVKTAVPISATRLDKRWAEIPK
jgi:ATP-dependent helicase HrpA